jgi:hypothetical protein
VRGVDRRIEAGFRNAAKAAVREALATGVSVAVMTDDDHVVWLHPDGVVRPAR